MSATLSILSNFSLPAQGRTLTGKQGAADDAVDTSWDVTVTGLVKEIVGSLATATAVTVYDSSADVPATFSYGFFWSDQICYIQIIGSATNAVFKVAAQTPFWISGYGSILAAAATTAITGGAEPAVTAVGKVVLGNYSGNTMNYTFTVIS